jgi:hypothetical protein
MTMYPLRTFTPAGMREFQRRWSVASDAGLNLDVQDMLEDTNWTQVITKDAVVEFREFASRRQCGEYFVELFSSVQESLKVASIDPAVSVELWAWLSAFWSEWLQQKDGGPVPLLKNGNLGERARWLFEPTARRRYYRHLLAGPYLIVAANLDDTQRAQILLYNDVVNPNTRWVEDICGSEEVLFNKRLLSALSAKLINPSSGEPISSASALTRRGSYFASRGIDQTGTISRLTKVYNQLVRTWDLNVTDLEQMTNLFGDEFVEFFPER